MAASGKEKQLIELKDMIHTLNDTIRSLQGTIAELNASLKEKDGTIGNSVHRSTGSKSRCLAQRVKSISCRQMAS